jgi:hypothetical protein
MNRRDAVSLDRIGAIPKWYQQLELTGAATHQTLTFLDRGEAIPVQFSLAATVRECRDRFPSEGWARTRFSQDGAPIFEDDRDRIVDIPLTGQPITVRRVSAGPPPILGPPRRSQSAGAAPVPPSPALLALAIEGFRNVPSEFRCNAARVCEIKAEFARQFGACEMIDAYGRVINGKVKCDEEFLGRFRLAIVPAGSIMRRTVTFGDGTSNAFRVCSFRQFRDFGVAVGQRCAERGVGFARPREDDFDEQISPHFSLLECGDIIHCSGSPRASVDRTIHAEPADYRNQLETLERVSGQSPQDCRRCFNYHQFRFADALDDLITGPDDP